jgi:long-chain-fatty-acid--[acyl-carrier-protein] ligase
VLDALIRGVIRSLLWLRYRITVRGLDELYAKDERGILFLPNHPALIDPIILLTTLSRRFRVGVVADRAQVERPVVRLLAKRIPVLAFKDPGRERDAKAQIEQLVETLTADLNRGQSFVLYPAGRIYRQKFEELGGNSAVETLLRACPQVRVVLVRTEGLWGSAFSRASGKAPAVTEVLKRGLIGMLKSGLFLMPRRSVTVSFAEPTDVPREGERNVINRYLERFYNEGVKNNTYVPYSFWETGTTREVPEPTRYVRGTRDREIPEVTQALVINQLRELTGISEIRPAMRLAMDLGLDSLARVELQAWIEREFGFPQSEGDAFDTVEDVLFAACGEGSHKVREDIKPIHARWFEVKARRALRMADGDSLTEAFLNAAAARPGQVIVADQTSGVRTYRELVTAVLVLRDELTALDGDYVGLMLPASVGAVVAYLATLFAGKTPVLLNFTTGVRGVSHSVELLGIKHLISARKLMEKLRNEGFDVTSPLFSRTLYLDELSTRISLVRKLKAAFLARVSWRALRRVTCPETVAVLFTSGSESVPKAVPLTSQNILTNDRDVLREIAIDESDSLLAMLPPFHAFGLTVDLVLPLVTGLRVVYHNNPTESAKIAALIEQYQTTIIVGTPTFLGGIVGAATPGQLRTLRLAVTGAEQCPARVYDALAERCPHTTVLEGYGITECSPVVSVNLPGREVRGTIGELQPSLEAVIVDPEHFTEVSVGTRGLLLVRGPSVFNGYLSYDGPSPFVEYAGKTWYKTNDLVYLDERHILHFCGRLKRFVKIGGEMISLPVIEAVLERALLTSDSQEPQLAVECSSTEHPEIVLFATFDVAREVVNRKLREAGLSPLYNVRSVVRLESIPLLGTGKTDYRALKASLVSAGDATTKSG